MNGLEKEWWCNLGVLEAEQKDLDRRKVVLLGEMRTLTVERERQLYTDSFTKS